VIRPTITILVCFLLAGCIFHPRYTFKDGVNHTMPQTQMVGVTVVYLPKDEIHQIALDAFKRDGISIRPEDVEYQITGFFDYKTRTLYCELWDAEVCGHELFHATHDDWHETWLDKARNR